MHRTYDLRVSGSECRCADLTRLEGAAARTYAEGHLLERATDDGVGAKLREWGFGFWRCPQTGWQFESASQDRGRPGWLRRLPFTTAEDYLDREVIAGRAAEISAANRLVHEAVIHRSDSLEAREVWKAACLRFREARDALYSPDLRALIQRLRRDDRVAVEAAIVYLEVDPWCRGSGCTKQIILNELSRSRLTETERERIRTALVDALLKGRRPGPEFTAMRRLARHVRSEGFVEQLATVREEAHEWQRPAVDALLDAVRSSRRSLSRRRRRG